MNSNYRALLTLTKFSGQLKEKELIDFAAFFLWADDRDLSMILKSIRRRPTFIRVLFDNLQAKRTAAKTKDPKKWNQILEEEVAFLNQE